MTGAAMPANISGMASLPHRYETRHAGRDALRTHRHGGAYAALVVDGSHVESSAEGPMACTPGALLLHPRFHAHGNRFGRHGARVLNLALDPAIAPAALVALQASDLREARRIFVLGDAAALADLIAASQPLASEQVPWQIALVSALCDSDEPVARIAARLGVSAAHASRAILHSYGMGPQALRRELRWRRALALLRGDAPLAEVAARAGFADQSHFSRVVLACSGLSPARLRLQIKCVQDEAPGAMAQSVPGLPAIAA
jgi:AraC-like DNA-binding protein